MKVNRKELLNVLKDVQPGVATKETVEQSASFVFHNDRVSTYNDEVSVSAPLKVGITGSVPAKEFLALINKLSAEEINIKIEKNELRVVSGKSKAGLRLEEEIKLPLEELGQPEEWYDLPEKFCEAVKFALFSVGKDQQKYKLTHIHINGDVVESSDGYRATRYFMEEGSDMEPILIPGNAAKILIGYNPIEYALTNGWLHFRNKDGLNFSTRWPEGEDYPDMNGFIEVKGEPIQLPKGLSEMMERGAVLSDGQRLSILLEDGGDLVLSTENEAGWFEEESKIDDYKGKTLEFDIYPEFLNKILSIEAETSVSEKLMKFETDDFVHVVALLKKKK